ncbi:pilus (MSHA type) biogenesis protein MshL [Woeseia oceani]|uniref:Pilus (MSHA type) biogenesis protein MshL n=1 Tax=Woeseia oceani TaxID=1548547 RepID=A0A193LHW1_9GAMM|nr:pilus (MSHA type) biogenesis protein MshL [Woeseia oceani]ANO52097.1 pilus (MSHA type) biogenesis protein MshL [Woeseia oceani]
MIKNLATAVAVTLLTASCATGVPRGESTERSIQAAMDEARAPAPARPAATKPDPVAAGPSLPQFDEERFDVNSSNTPAGEFFMALVDGTRHNIVVHPDVTGSVSLTLKNVNVNEVLDVVSDVYGYAYRRSGAGFIVLPASVQSRIFQIDYLNLQRSGSSRTRVSSGQVTESSRTGRNRGGIGGLQDPLSGASGYPGSENSQQQVSGSRIETNYEADFWAELQDTVESIVGSQNGHSVVVNAQAGVVVVSAMPDKLRDVETYLQTIQSIAQRQVILEAKIVEVQLNEGYQAGINWVAVAQNSQGDNYTFGQLAPPGDFSGSLDELGGDSVVVSPGSAIDGFIQETLGGAFTMAFDVGDFNAFIELLESQGDTRVLSSPRVSTLNNQKAVIKAGSDEFFVTSVSSNTVTGTSSTTSRDVELTPFFSGIALDVTPQISASGEVILHIHPTVSEVIDQQKALTVSGETDTLPLAFSEIRESDSIVKARSGQIIVIGGLMRNSSRKQSFATPVLGRIPGVGALFRSQRDVESKTELVILLKPIVVDNDSVWATAARDSMSRMQLSGGL